MHGILKSCMQGHGPVSRVSEVTPNKSQLDILLCYGRLFLDIWKKLKLQKTQGFEKTQAKFSKNSIFRQLQWNFRPKYYAFSRLFKQRLQNTVVLLKVCKEKPQFLKKKQIIRDKTEEIPKKLKDIKKKLNDIKKNSSKFAKNSRIRQLELVWVAEKRPKRKAWCRHFF